MGVAPSTFQVMQFSGGYLCVLFFLLLVELNELCKPCFFFWCVCFELRPGKRRTSD